MRTAHSMRRAPNPSEPTREEKRLLSPPRTAVQAPLRHNSGRCGTLARPTKNHSFPRAACLRGGATDTRSGNAVIEAAVWFSDLRDFTMLTELLPAEEVLEALNAYLALIEDVISGKGGEILCLTGDAILIAFPVGNGRDLKNVCAASLEAALKSLEALESVNQQRTEQSKPPIQFGVGLDVGEITSGQVGLSNGPDRNTVGRSVNRAARQESQTKTVGAPLLLSKDFAARIDRPVRPVGRFPLKGIADPQLVYILSEQSPQDQELDDTQAAVFVVDEDRSICD